MIKLKVGENFIITSNKDRFMKQHIVYMMTCFKGSGKLCVGYTDDTTLHDNYIKSIKANNPKEIYLLIDKGITKIGKHRNKNNVSFDFLLFITNIRQTCPNIVIKIIDITNKKESRLFRIGSNIYDALSQDKTNILYHINYLDDYKALSTRYKAIPSEIKAISDSIKKLNKDSAVCQRKIGIKDLEYLNMIDNIEIDPMTGNLVVDIKELELNPSEPFGRIYTESSFRDNPYLYKAASYLYQGCKFRMVPTKIAITKSFRPEFLNTRDHKFDDMFKAHNWSSIGYLHFGIGHLCGGEFNDVIAHTTEYGIEYYFIALKQYITTANMRDMAGERIWWYPIYDSDGKMVYCAGLDILRDAIIKGGHVSAETAREIKNMSLEEFLEWKNSKRIKFSDIYIPQHHKATQSGREDTFLAVCKTKDKELYDKIMKGAN